jgi:hypothetical protein
LEVDDPTISTAISKLNISQKLTIETSLKLLGSEDINALNICIMLAFFPQGSSIYNLYRILKYNAADGEYFSFATVTQ